jgi:hypothetical protein
MRNKSPFIVLAMLIVTTLACSVLSPEAPTPTAAAKVPTSKPAATTAPVSKALLQEDFASSKSGWSVNANDNGSAEYLDGEYVFKIKRTKWLKWSTTPDDKNYSNVHLEVSVRDTSADKTTLPSFGFVCGYQDNNNFYYVGAAVDGAYAIARKINGETKILTDAKNEWAISKDIAKNMSSYRLGADCTPSGVTLFVDGKKIASVSDSSFSSGLAGLFVLTFDKASAEVRFDDFAITQLK